MDCGPEKSLLNFRRLGSGIGLLLSLLLLTGNDTVRSVPEVCSCALCRVPSVPSRRDTINRSKLNIMSTNLQK